MLSLIHIPLCPSTCPTHLSLTSTYSSLSLHMSSPYQSHLHIFLSVSPHVLPISVSPLHAKRLRNAAQRLRNFAKRPRATHRNFALRIATSRSATSQLRVTYNQRCNGGPSRPSYISVHPIRCIIDRQRAFTGGPNFQKNTDWRIPQTRSWFPLLWNAALRSADNAGFPCYSTPYSRIAIKQATPRPRNV